VVGGGGGVVVGGGGGVVVGGGGGVVVGGGGGVVVGGGGGGTMDIVGAGRVVWVGAVAGGCTVFEACELDVSVRGRAIAAAMTTTIRTEMIVARLDTCSP
jgi:hypothetical protein